MTSLTKEFLAPKKKCGGCKQEKPISSFHRHAGREDGLSFYCKECKASHLKDDRKHNPEKYHAFGAAYRQRHAARVMITRARVRAAELGVPFNLIEADVQIPERCPVLGIPLQINQGRGSRDSSPSLDRFVPSLGYVHGNVCVISLKANRIKNNGTPEELMAVALWCSSKGAN